MTIARNFSGGVLSGRNFTIRGIFLLVETLDEFQRNIGRVGKLLVAIHLQRGEVVEMRGRLVSLFLAYICNREGFASDGTECFLAFLLAGKLAAGGSKLGVAVDGGEYPVRFGNEVVDFLLPPECLSSAVTKTHY